MTYQGGEVHMFGSIASQKGTSPISISADAYSLYNYVFLPLCQDPHLNRFFQQCQKRELDLSLPPTSNFLNCLKVREKAPQKYKRLAYWTLLRVLTSATLLYCAPNILFLPFSWFKFLPAALLFCSVLQGLLSMEKLPVIIRFLPVLFNQLFKVLTQNDNDEVTTATTR